MKLLFILALWGAPEERLLQEEFPNGEFLVADEDLAEYNEICAEALGVPYPGEVDVDWDYPID